MRDSTSSGPSPRGGTFEMSGGVTQPERSAAGKGKRPREPEGDKTAGSDGPPIKKQKKAGICRLFKVAPSGCPYGNKCIFTHRCNNCGAVNEHHRQACPFPPKREP